MFTDSDKYGKHNISYQESLAILFLVQFMCWILLEIFERRFGMQPAIRRRSSFDRMAQLNTENSIEKQKYSTTNLRLTKKLDNKGRFRIQTRGSIYLVKTIWQSVGLIYCIIIMITDSNWWIQHFYYLNENTIHIQFIPNICAIIIGYYSWEMGCNRYAKLSYAIAAHHWMSALAAVTIIYFDRFDPLLSWYGLVGLFSAGIPINLSLTFRSSSYKRYAYLNTFIQRLLKFAGYWYLIHLLVLFVGVIIIIANQWLKGYYSNSVPRLISFVFTILSFSAFGYNDILTLRALFQLSHVDYSILQKNKARLPLHKRNKLSKSATNIANIILGNNDNDDKNGDEQTVIHHIDEYEYEAYPIKGSQIYTNTNKTATTAGIDAIPPGLFDHSSTIRSMNTFNSNTLPTMGTIIVNASSGDTEMELTDITNKRGLPQLEPVDTDGNILEHDGITLRPKLVNKFSIASALSSGSRTFIPLVPHVHRRDLSQSHTHGTNGNRLNLLTYMNNMTDTPSHSRLPNLHSNYLYSNTNDPSTFQQRRLPQLSSNTDTTLSTAPTIPSVPNTSSSNKQHKFTSKIIISQPKIGIEQLSSSPSPSPDQLNSPQTGTTVSISTPIPMSAQNRKNMKTYLNKPKKSINNISLDLGDDDSDGNNQWSDTEQLEAIYDDIMHDLPGINAINNSNNKFKTVRIDTNITNDQNQPTAYTPTDASMDDFVIIHEPTNNTTTSDNYSGTSQVLTTLHSDHEMNVAELLDVSKSANVYNNYKGNKNNSRLLNVKHRHSKSLQIPIVNKNNTKIPKMIELGHNSVGIQTKSKSKSFDDVKDNDNDNITKSTNIINIEPNKSAFGGKRHSFLPIQQESLYTKNSILPLAKGGNVNTGTAVDLQYKNEIDLQSMNQIENHLPPEYENVGVFNMHDDATGIIQQVIIIRKLKLKPVPISKIKIISENTEHKHDDNDIDVVLASDNDINNNISFGQYSNTKSTQLSRVIRNKPQLNQDKQLNSSVTSTGVNYNASEFSKTISLTDNGILHDLLQEQLFRSRATSISNNLSLNEPSTHNSNFSIESHSQSFDLNDTNSPTVSDLTSNNNNNLLINTTSNSLKHKKWLRRLTKNVNDLFNDNNRYINDGAYIDYYDE